MKKLLTILALVLALCMLMGVALAADDDEEQGDSAFGGISYEEAMRIHEIEGHEVEGDPEIIRESTCSVRGIVRYKCVTDPTHFHELYLAKTEHKWGPWIESGDPCTTGITRTHTCVICGETETEKLQAASHLWASDYANWSDEDKEKYSPFDPNIEMSSSNPNDMSWGVVGEKPTCTEPGWAVDFCARCLKIRWDDPDSIRAIDPLGHKFGDEIAVETQPNCLEPGTRTFIHKCERCGYTENVPDKEPEEIPVPVPVPDYMHDWDKPIVVEAPTCWKDGKALRWCVRCGDKQEIVLERLEPNYVPLLPRLVDCYTMEITYTCAYCHGVDDEGNEIQDHANYTETIDVIAHTFIHEDGATYSENYKAFKGTWEQFLNKIDFLVTDECVEPTCEEDGLLVFKCIYDGDDRYANCDHTVEEGKYEYEEVVLPALGHDWNPWELRYEPGYDGQNNKSGYWLRDCARCGQTQERISEYAPEDACAEHQYGDVIAHKDPTCTEPGYDKKQCSYCGHIHTFEIEATGHDFNEFVTPATCTEDGMIVRVCNVCNAVETEEVPALGHKAKVIEGYEPTCVEDGETEHTICERCGEVLIPGEPIPCVGHHDYVTAPAVAATCTEAGLKEGAVCSVCGDVLVAQEEIPALGHDWDEGVVTDPACGVDGYITYTCARCGETRVEEGEPALEHAWGEPVIVDPTCTEDGTKTYTCANCGEKKVEAGEKALGHDWDVTVLVAATCTEEGEGLFTCKRCGEYHKDILPIVDHTEEIVPGYAATCGKDGLSDGKVCSVCGEVLAEQEVIPATGEHDYQVVAAVAATCTEDGATDGVVCTICGDELIAPEVVKALGHDFGEGTETAPTCTEAGYITYVCARCGEEKVEEGEPALGHTWDEGVVTKEATKEEKGDMTYTCTVCGETKVEEGVVDYVVTAPAWYELTELNYDGQTVTGKVLHVEDTKEVEKLYIRVTFFLEGSYYMATIGEVAEDGTFSVDGVGPIEYISLVLTAGPSVNPEDVQKLADPGEIYVK